MKLIPYENGILLCEAENFDPFVSCECGQCFRFTKIDEDEYELFAKGRVLDIKRIENGWLFKDIEEEEFSNGLSYGDEYVMECQGEAEVDPDEINDLIADRDPHALAFFGLEDADDDELDEWDANDLDELPLIKDFVEGFEPYSPYDEGWTLNVEFVDPNNDW
jgi:hypothetical protein